MRVFVTGGTGVLGRATLARLVDADHDVVASVRSPERAELVRTLGAAPVEVDLLDLDDLRRATSGCTVLVHLATSIPPLAKMARRSAWATNDRLRGEVTPLLAQVARERDGARLVAESVTFMYPDCGDRWIDESVDWPPPAPAWKSTYALEDAVRGVSNDGGEGVVLRFGLFYGPAARSVDEALRLARLRLATVAGAPSAFISSVHTDDAAAAVVAALGVPSGTYNVCDQPVTREAYLDAFSGAFGLRRLRPQSARLTRLVGGSASEILVRSQRVSNGRFTGATGWSPEHRSVVEGWPAVARDREAVS